MPLPIAGGRPTRPPTHAPIDMRRLMNVAAELEDALGACGASALSPVVVEEIAADLGASELEVYVAAATMTEVACDASAPVRFELCVGGCQAWGAASLLRHLLDAHARQREGGGAAFGIVCKRCLDRCDRAAVVLVHTPDGTAGLAEATTSDLDEALATLSA